MTYTSEFNVDTFQFWGGAKDIINEVKKAGKMDELQFIIKEAFIDNEHPTATDINDFVWFDNDLIYSQLGIEIIE